MGWFWSFEGKARTLWPGEVAQVKATVKLKWDQPGPFVVLETDEKARTRGLEMVPELVPTRDLYRRRKRVPIRLKNMTDQPIMLRPWMLVGQVSAANPLLPEEVKGEKDGQGLERELQHCAENLPSQWQERAKSQLKRWEKLFAQNDFDVGCAKSARHTIRLQEDKPFCERAR